jgi:hypothetical protein
VPANSDYPKIETETTTKDLSSLYAPLFLLYFVGGIATTFIILFFPNTIIAEIIGGLFFGALFLGLCLLFKFFLLKTFKRWHLYFALFIMVGVYFDSYTWYNSLNLYYNGIEKKGELIQVISKIEQGAAVDGVPSYYNSFTGKVKGFEKDIYLTKNYQKGQEIWFIYPPGDKSDAEESFGPTLRFKTIRTYGGYQFSSSIFYTATLFIVWFIMLWKQGSQLVKEKLKAEEQWYSKILIWVAFTFSYLIYAIFVLAIFKNFFSNISYSFLSTFACSLFIMTILVTNWGELAFAFSTGLMLELKKNKWVEIIKKVLKIFGLFSFTLVLFNSLVHHNISIIDSVKEFADKIFDIDIKPLWDAIIGKGSK